MERIDIENVVKAIQAIGPDSTWRTPDGYPNSLALCVLDAIWSVGVNYDEHVIPVLDRYRQHRADSGRDASQDSVNDLRIAIMYFGPERFSSEIVKNKQRTSTRSGILKSDAVLRATTLFCKTSVFTCSDFKSRQDDVYSGWLVIPGQKSGISWRYLRILTGEPDIKPDRMIMGFVSSAIDRPVSPAEAITLLVTAHREMELASDLRTLDYAIWSHQRQA